MGGGSDKASKQAEANEARRQAGIQSSTGSINAIFNDPARQGQYGQLEADTTRYLTDDLNRKKVETDRGVKFAMARSGQYGGSVARDTNAAVGRDYLRGVVEASRRGQASGADLRQSDEQARNNLLAMTQGGLDATTASSNATLSLRNNLLSGQAGARADGIGDVFGSFAETYRKSQDAAADRRSRRDFNTNFQAGFGYGGRP